MPKKTSQSMPTDTQVAPPSNHWKFILAGIVIAILGGIALINQTAPEMLHLTSEKPSVSGEIWDFSESDDKVPYDTKVLSLILPTSVDS